MMAAARTTLIGIVLSVLCGNVFAANYYVAPATAGGNDGNAGTQASPWATLQKAANTVSPGDVVTVADGTYSPFYVSRSGQSSAPIVFRAANQHAATISGNISYGGRWAGIHITGSYITIDGFRVESSGIAGRRERAVRVSGEAGSPIFGVVIRNNIVRNGYWCGITTSHVNDVVVEYNEVSGAREDNGIYIGNSGDNPIVRYNTVYDNWLAGIHMNGDLSVGGDGVISNALVEGNIIYDNTRLDGGAINMDGVTNSIIRNNLLFNNHLNGITNFQADGGEASHSNQILNNTVIMPSTGRHALSFRNGSINGYVRNNILINLGSNDAMAIDQASWSGFDSDYNIYSEVEGPDGVERSVASWKQQYPNLDQNSIQAPALTDLFVNPVNDPVTADYRLLASSAAVDRGVSVANAAMDILKQQRPSGAAYDIGAYEYVSGTALRAPANVRITKQ